MKINRVKCICCHFTRNYAYFRAGEEACQNGRASDFWRVANGNFAEISIVEFCKLFGGKQEKHRWQKVISDKVRFRKAIEDSISITFSDFDSYVDEIREYRDKYLSHLDEVDLVPFPALDNAMKAVSVYYQQVLEVEGAGNFPASLDDFFEASHAEASVHYPTT